jgi:hypothetical protein
MVLPIERPLCQWFVLAIGMVMRLDVRIIWTWVSAKDAAYLVVLRVEFARAIRATHPSLKG